MDLSIRNNAIAPYKQCWDQREVFCKIAALHLWSTILKIIRKSSFSVKLLPLGSQLSYKTSFWDFLKIFLTGLDQLYCKKVFWRTSKIVNISRWLLPDNRKCISLWICFEKKRCFMKYFCILINKYFFKYFF